MKILLVTPSYYPIIGGSEALTRNFAKELNEIGIRTDIMCLNMNRKWHPSYKEEIEKDGMARVFKIPAFNPFQGLPNFVYPLFRINVLPKPSFVKKLSDYDIVHFISEVDLSFPLMSYFVERPKIMQCCGMFEKGGIYKYYMSERPYFRKIFGKVFNSIADWFIIQGSMEPKLLSDLGIPKNKIFLLPHAINTETFAPNYDKKKDNLLLFVGRIEKIKGLHIIVQALSYVETPAQLAVIGPEWDEDYVRGVKQMANEINEQRIHTVKFIGPMDQNSLIKWYQKAAIVVCPYSYETYSFVVLEALACGTPVVSTGTHILENKLDGVILTTSNPKRLANAINSLLNDDEKREKKGKEGRNMVEQLFSWKIIIKDLEAFYKQILTNQRQRSETRFA